ncbi:DNA/RNA non-specific endonuclease [Actinomyces sp. zg296]|uniref:DNA/RNA non-specific endonuclease n=1 Tax=Actinomyces sp. zg296 TaxID=2609289 RepID=UPI0013573D06|nr:DNA/RNA non-specific endonuclease [Actinomyces sp. zg296]
MAQTPFDETKIPCLSFDIASVETAASTMKTKAGDLRAAGQTIQTTWSGLSGCYSAPEQETLYAAMDPVKNNSDDLARDLESLAGALTTFASTVSGIKARARTLQADGIAFKAKIAGDDKWDHDQDKVNENNALIERANKIRADLWVAEVECANTIRALDDLEAFHTDPTSDNDPLGYGYSEIPAGTEGLPWGSPVGRKDDCPKAAGVQVKRFVWDGVVCEGLGGTLRGLGNLVGVDYSAQDGWSWSGETASNTWKGLGSLVGLSEDENGGYGWHGFDAAWSTARDSWGGAVKGLVCADQWGDDPARAAGGAAFNLATFIVGAGAGASKAGKLGASGSKLARAGQVAVTADRVLTFLDPVGAGLGKLVEVPTGFVVGKAKAALKLDFDLNDVIGRWTGADVGSGIDTPRVDADVPGGGSAGGSGMGAPEVGRDVLKGENLDVARGGTHLESAADSPGGSRAAEGSPGGGAGDGAGSSRGGDGAGAGGAGAGARGEVDGAHEGPGGRDGADAAHGAETDLAHGGADAGHSGEAGGARDGGDGAHERNGSGGHHDSQAEAGHQRADAEAGHKTEAERADDAHERDGSGGHHDGRAEADRTHDGADADAGHGAEADRARDGGDGAHERDGSGGHHDSQAEAGHQGPDAEAGHKTEADRSADGAGGPGHEGADGAHGGEGTDGELEPGSPEAIRRHLEQRRAAGDADEFNRAHRPELPEGVERRRVEVLAGDGLMPGPRQPFGRGVELEPNAVYHVEGRGDYYTDASGQIRHAELFSAVERFHVWGERANPMNKDLNDPLPNVTYTVDGTFHYTTDGAGRTVLVEADGFEVARWRRRSKRLQAQIGHLGGEGFNGGHLAAHGFGGPPEAINVVPMHRDVNLPVKDVDTFYAFEQDVRKNPHDYRDIRVEVHYADPDITSPTGSLEGLDPASRVPEEFIVKWTDRNGGAREAPYKNSAIDDAAPR